MNEAKFQYYNYYHPQVQPKAPINVKYTVGQPQSKQIRPLRADYYSPTFKPVVLGSKINYTATNSNIFTQVVSTPKYQSSTSYSYLPKPSQTTQQTPFMTVKTIDIQKTPYLSQQKQRPQSARYHHSVKNDELTVSSMETPRKAVYSSQVQTQRRFQRTQSAQAFTPRSNSKSEEVQHKETQHKDVRIQVLNNQDNTRMSIDDFEFL